MGFVEDELKHLRDVIGGLESRIKQLEQRATGAAPVTTESLRMILIGPPGAGECFYYGRGIVKYAS
jgi:adenylate kinase